MLMILVLVVAAVAGLLALLAAGLQGLRDGDRPLDVTVRAGPAGHPEGAPRAVLAWVHNPGPVPVLVGLSVRRSHRPGWLSPALNARVPWRTRHPKFGPQAQDTVGVVAPGESEGWPVAAPGRGQRGRLVAVVGQANGRLRVITLAVPLAPAGYASRWPARRPSASRR
jgi:hypothetical protein